MTADNFLSDIFEYRFNKIKADKSESSFNFNTKPELKFFRRVSAEQSKLHFQIQITW